MEIFSQAVSGLFKSNADLNAKTYTRSEESSYVYRLNPDGKGATVATTVNGTYNFNKNLEGKTTQTDQGQMAGIFGGELDENGRIVKGGFQKWTKEGDTEKMEMRGSVDPTMFAEKVGLTKPLALKPHTFDPSKAVIALGSENIDALMDELATTETFARDPVMTSKVVHKPHALSV